MTQVPRQGSIIVHIIKLVQETYSVPSKENSSLAPQSMTLPSPILKPKHLNYHISLSQLTLLTRKFPRPTSVLLSLRFEAMQNPPRRELRDANLIRQISRYYSVSLITLITFHEYLAPNTLPGSQNALD